MSASTGLALTGPELLSQAVANASPAIRPHGSNGIEHVVVLMMENRSFDHFLGWLPGADGRHDLTFPAPDGNAYPNYPLAPDFQGCGYSDPDHSWEGFLVQSNDGKMDGFLQRPTTPETNPGVTPGRGQHASRWATTPTSTRTAGRKAVPDLPVIGALAEHYTVLDRYFCSFAGETFPNRFYQHAARTDRDHNSSVISTLPTIWDQLSPIPNTRASRPAATSSGTRRSWRCGAPSTCRSGTRSPTATPTPWAYPSTRSRSSTPWPSASCPTSASSTRPSTPRATGTSADDHPLADIRLGERFIADTYHALADAGYLDNTVLVVTFDEWGGFYDHVPPPRVVDDTEPGGRRPHRRRHDAHRRPARSPTTGSSVSACRPSSCPTWLPPVSSTTARSSTPRR